MTNKLPFLRLINNHNDSLRSTIETLTAAVRGGAGKGMVALAIAGSEVSDLPGLSAAGADGAARRMTPAIDAEAMVLGRPASCRSLPMSPEGVVSPVVAARAMLVGLLGCVVQVFDCGTFTAPKVPVVRVGNVPARSPDTGAALTYAQVEQLFDDGKRHGKWLASSCDYLVIAECVPGGTTTALGVLTALGFPAASLVSSSMPALDRHRRTRLIEEGLRKAALEPSVVQRAPLHAVAAVGDPMQAFACGVALGASLHIPVVLAGGTQMLAVYSLAAALEWGIQLRNLCVVTTKWVAFDPTAGAGELSHLVGAPFAAACPDFNQSRHAGLRAYEQGNVKEGVGLGASLALAHLAGYDDAAIIRAVDRQYDQMVPEQIPFVVNPIAPGVDLSI
jgi:uncharacterized protein (TIGR00303 family)